MSIALNLLGDVRWRGRPVAGDRPQALLAALAARDCRPVRAEDLIKLIWGDEAPRNGMKSLQVLVYRARTVCGADAIIRDSTGYRLGAGPDEVDGPLADVRRAATSDASAARVILAQASSRTGAHAAALPDLEAAYAGQAHDETLLADLLHSEAVVRGPAVALERFERYRRDLRERLGADPGESLQRVHRGLLSLDRPVRRGVRYDATELIGRDHDLERLRSPMASARVVSIVGPGGLGKTRLAHALARDAAEPAVYVVELAGVTSAEDVAAEIGSVLGVRDSVRDRRRLTAEQRADVQARIAQQLGRSPCLLVLDNCEHLIGAVAGLVAYLVTATADLRVLTTSRAPLAIAAERVYPLGELQASDAVRLFQDRAVAARPGVHLPDQAVTSIVARLDGLPLAIELAAAKVRVMSLAEIDRRLEDRFALLRGGDRSAPDRHQALLTVIEWSWNLLDDDEQRALRRLALFHEGFTLEAAETVLGNDAMRAVQGLVHQSLLGVRETSAGVRYRMLETVREFGCLRLAGAGEERAARAVLRRWANGYAREHAARVLSAAQFEAIDALGAEETNLADELRGAITEGDSCSLVQLLSALGLFWTLRGEHTRVLVLLATATGALRDWQPPPELADEVRATAAIITANTLMAGTAGDEPLRALLRRLGPGDYPPLQGLVRVVLAYDWADIDATVRRLDRLAEGDDRSTALAASQWLTHLRENAGDLAGATRAASRTLALTRDEDGPWSTAMAHVLLAELTMHVGDRAAAVHYSRTALPVMKRLGAIDDEIQLRSQLVLCAIADGRLADADDELSRLDSIGDPPSAFGAGTPRLLCRGELALARGDYAAGLHLYRECAVRMRELCFPGATATGVEPWALFGESVALSAHARYATGEDETHGRALFRTCCMDVLQACRSAIEGGYFDYPVGGTLLLGLGTWTLLRLPARAEDGLRLLALADRFRYNSMVPTMTWEHILPLAEEAAPGRIAALQAEYRNHELTDLLTEACRLVDRVSG